MNNFVVGGLAKSSLIDYPEKISAIVFTQGCNFRCGFCHNPELSKLQNTDFNVEKIFDFLSTRIGKLDAVVITGGEPTLQIGLKDFVKRIKEMNFLVKLDTNGSNPKVVDDLINENLLDYIAMDIKSPLEKYSEITQVKVDVDNVKTSIDLIMRSGVEYEFRTTVLKSQLDFSDFEKIGDLICGAKRYYLQKFEPTKLIDESLYNEKSYTDKEFEPIVNMLKTKINLVEVR